MEQQTYKPKGNYLNQRGEIIGEPCLICHTPIWYIEEDSFELFENQLIHKSCKEEAIHKQKGGLNSSQP